MTKFLKEGYKRNNESQTKRYCQFLELNANSLDEYTYWHDSKNTWKEIPQGIREVGILDMEIYLIGNKAFMVVETPLDFEWDTAFAKLATLDRQAEWEEFVSKFQNAGGNKRSDEKWQLMERIYSLIESLA